MIIKSKCLPNGIHHSIIEAIRELEADKPALTITFKSKKTGLTITQRFPAHLNPGSPLLPVVLSTLGEVTEELDTDDLIGCECIIEVDYVEHKNKHYQNVVNVFPAEDEEIEGFDEDSESYDDDASSEDFEVEEEDIEPPTKTFRKKRNFNR